MVKQDPQTPRLPPLVTLGAPRLARPSAAVPLEEIPTAEFQARLETLAGAMAAYEGIGIAAPQLGWFERFVLMTEATGEVEDAQPPDPRAVRNPALVSTSPHRSLAGAGARGRHVSAPPQAGQGPIAATARPPRLPPGNWTPAHRGRDQPLGVAGWS